MTSGIHDTGEVTRTPGTETAVLAGGCFWGVDELIRKQPGVISTRAGYTGGQNDHATYRNHPGHAEAVEIVFDPSKTTYRDILAFFFQIHDPSTLNRQGNDIGTQYRSAIYWTSPEQETTARELTKVYGEELARRELGEITTELRPAEEAGYYYAEDPHQQYLAKNPFGYRCHANTGVAFPA